MASGEGIIAAYILVPFFVLVVVIIVVKLWVIGWIYGEVKQKPDFRIHVPSNFISVSTYPVTNQQSNSLAPPSSIFPDTASHSEKRFTFQQVVEMTNNFENQFGRGGFGPVYYGKIADGRAVAVKRLSAESSQGPVQFQNEVDILLRVHHRNLVSLIGYCKEFEERILIYEYVPEGALEDHLHRRDNFASNPPLRWETRIRIALDAANGLKYLHTDCDPKIIHRDVKTSNILLDEKLTAKVADFGLSKSFPRQSLTHITTGVKGTRGYLDPEYANGLDRLTEKSDVYSFGIVLLELLSGARQVLETPSGPQNISQWARPYILGNKVNEIVDKALEDDYNLEAFIAVSLLALQCVEFKGSARPSMSEVLQQLELIAKTHLKSRATLESNDFDNSMQSLGSTNSIEAHTTMTMPLVWDAPSQHHDLPTHQYSY